MIFRLIEDFNDEREQLTLELLQNLYEVEEVEDILDQNNIEYIDPWKEATNHLELFNIDDDALKQFSDDFKDTNYNDPDNILYYVDRPFYVLTINGKILHLNDNWGLHMVSSDAFKDVKTFLNYLKQLPGNSLVDVFEAYEKDPFIEEVEENFENALDIFGIYSEESGGDPVVAYLFKTIEDAKKVITEIPGLEKYFIIKTTFEIYNGEFVDDYHYIGDYTLPAIDLGTYVQQHETCNYFEYLPDAFEWRNAKELEDNF